MTHDFHPWTYTSTTDGSALIMPDGCVDIVVEHCPKTGARSLRLTQRDFGPRRVTTRGGSTLTGYRLRPGVQVDMAEIGADPTALADQLRALGSKDAEPVEMIEALCLPNTSVAQVARTQGLSERSLQRYFRDHGLPPPRFWRQLGRARRAAQALPLDATLSDIALDMGYSDQAHMTRAFTRWFGCSPGQLRADPTGLAQLGAPGLGNWQSAA